MSPLRHDPQSLFRRVAIAEAVTWALLLLGMFLKYVTETTELGVRVFGMLHGVVFIAYCLTTLLVAVDQRWSKGRLLLGLAASVPPFLTVLFDRWAERGSALGGAWRLRSHAPSGAVERLASWLIRNPGRGALAGVVAVLALTGAALLVGPPA
jgi:integral membrane protein